MRAVIIGAGVAGTVAALALHKAGWESTIYEAYDHSAGLEQGVFLTVAVNGLDALAAVSAADAVRGLGFETGKISFTSGSGRDLGAMDIGPRLPDGTVTRTVRRAELYAALYDLAIDRGVRIEHGRRIVGADTTGDAVTARFADSTSVKTDALIGADGLRSTVRGLIDPTPRPRYTGMGNVGAFTHLDGIAFDGGDYRMMWGKKCFFGYSVSPDGEVWWFANPPARTPLLPDQVHDTTTDQMRSHLLDLFRDDAGPATDIIAATTGPILFGNQYDLPRVPHWHNDRMVIIGDAAHAVSPATGQGVSLACEDAVTLAQCLRDEPSVPAAYTRYEELRRDRVGRVAAWGKRMGGTKTTGPLTRIVRDAVLPRILAKGATPEAMDKQAWMFHHHIDWAHPAGR